MTGISDVFYHDDLQQHTATQDNDTNVQEECQRQLALRRKELNSAQRDVKVRCGTKAGCEHHGFVEQSRITGWLITKNPLVGW